MTNIQTKIAEWRTKNNYSLRTAAGIFETKARELKPDFKLSHQAIARWEDGSIPEGHLVRIALNSIIGLNDDDWVQAEISKPV